MADAPRGTFRTALTAFPLAGPARSLSLWHAADEPRAVQIAAQNVLDDAARLCPHAPAPRHAMHPETANVVVATLAALEGAVARGELRLPADLDLSVVREAEAPYTGAWEAFTIQPVAPDAASPGTTTAAPRLWIVGADRRGAVFGLYRFIETLGMSPWAFWADATPQPRGELVWTAGAITDSPAVRYRGIFLNDEEQLEEWAIAHTTDSTIGPETYARVCELLLRLGGNYLWSAMHVGAFNADPRNAEVTEELGVVVGTSHCDMLMRCNQHEWDPWLREKGYTGTLYDYSIGGENRERIGEFWRECVDMHAHHEVSWTLGMRGLHDWGFATKELDALGLDPEALLEARRDLLAQVIADQRTLLADQLGPATDEHGHPTRLTTFIPYKEVLPLYDAGLEVPEDVTIVWTNDNFGHMRRLPTAAEQARSGGNGLYYHSSYWAHPGMSYLYQGNTSLALMVQQLTRSWDHGIRQLWVNNVGALKPLELETELFLRAGWRAGRSDAITPENLETYLRGVLERDVPGLGAEGATRAADLVLDLGRALAVRRVEHLRDGVAPVGDATHPDDAARLAERLHLLAQQAADLLISLPADQRDTFYQLVGRRTLATWLLYGHYELADRSRHAADLGHHASAAAYAQRSREMRTAWRTLCHHDNHTLAGGAWSRIVQPEHFAPPVTPHDAAAAAVTPAALAAATTAPVIEVLAPHAVAVEAGEAGEVIEIDPWGSPEVVADVVSPAGGPLTIRVAAAGVEVDGRAGEHTLEVTIERRLALALASCQDHGTLTITAVGHIDAPTRHLRLRLRAAGLPSASGTIPHDAWVEGDGCVSIPLADALDKTIADGATRSGWHLHSSLGRLTGGSIEADGDGDGDGLTLHVVLREAGERWLHVYRTPTLNSTGHLRFDVEIDGRTTRVSSQARDEWLGPWRETVMAGVEIHTVPLGPLAPGTHCVRLTAVDEGVILQRLTIDHTPHPASTLPPPRSRRFEEGPTTGRRHPGAPWQPLAPRTDPLDALCAEPEPYLPPRPEALELEPPERIAGLEFPLPHGAPGKDGVFTRLTERLATSPDPTPAPGAVLLDLASAVVGNENGNQGVWELITSGPDHAPRTGLRTPPGMRAASIAEASHLTLRTTLEQPGDHTVWVRAWTDGESAGRLALDVDGAAVPVHGSRGETVDGADLWAYSTEHLWHWRALARLPLAVGEHTLTLHALDGNLRLDRLYLTTGEEAPPSQPV